MQETWVGSLGWEDSLEKGIATHFSILAWRISLIEEPVRLQSMGLQRVGHYWETLTPQLTLLVYFFSGQQDTGSTSDTTWMPTPHPSDDLLIVSSLDRHQQPLPAPLVDCKWVTDTQGPSPPQLSRKQPGWMTPISPVIWGPYTWGGILDKKLDMSNEGRPGWKGCKPSLNSIPDTPRRVHRYATKQPQRVCNSCTCALGTQWTQDDHRGFLK